MDILSQVLDTVHVSGSRGFRGVFRAPWGLSVQSSKDRAPFYVVSSGSMYVEVDGVGAPRRIASGDLVMLPNGGAHALSDLPGSPRRPLEELFDAQSPEDSAGAPPDAILRFGGDGPSTEIFTGTFHFDDDPTASILRSLGNLIHVRAEDEASPDFTSILGLSCRERRNPTPGSRFVVEELMKLLFIQALRSALTNPRSGEKDHAHNPFALMFDPRMNRVAEAIHLHLDQNWKVEELADIAGMSRTSFSLRFTEITGLSPLAYLTRWRMIKAAQLLRGTSATLSEVASQVGYGSDTALSIAFKREMGTAPGRYRARRSGMGNDPTGVAALP